VGAVTWVAPNAPHHSSYAPIYAAAPATPSSLTNVTQYKLDRTKNYWAHSVTGNYLSRWFKWTLDDVKSFQKSLEADIFKRQAKAEAKAVAALEEEDREKALRHLMEFHEDTGHRIVAAWWDFFWEMTAKYRDIYK
jgi:dipeptidase